MCLMLDTWLNHTVRKMKEKLRTSAIFSFLLIESFSSYILKYNNTLLHSDSLTEYQSRYTKECILSRNKNIQNRKLLR